MSHWDYLIAVTYVTGTVACGFYFARRQTTSEQYFLGGRGFGWFPLGLSMVAPLVSTTSDSPSQLPFDQPIQVGAGGGVWFSM